MKKAAEIMYLQKGGEIGQVLGFIKDLRALEKRKYKLKNNMSVSTKIAVMGVCAGVGTTHTAFMIANVLANGLRLRTAVVEMNNHRDFMKIRREYNVDNGTLEAYEFNNIDFYEKEYFDKVLSSERKYDCIIYDFSYNSHDYCDNSSSGSTEGAVYKKNNADMVKEFFYSDKKIVVTGTNPWKIGGLIRFLKNENPGKNTCTYISFDFNREQFLRIKKEYGIDIKKMPYEGNPFKIKADSLIYILDLLGMLHNG